MKHLPKHLRPRWRYIAIEIETWPDTDLDRETFQRHLWYACQNFLGDVGSAELDLRVLEFTFNEGFGEAIVRTYRDHVTLARAALGCVSDIEGQPVAVWVNGVSGTVRACEEKYLGRQPEVSTERTVVFESAKRIGVERNEAVDVRIGDAFIGAAALDIE